MMFGLIKCLQLLEPDSDSESAEKNILLLNIKNKVDRVPRMRCKNFIDNVVSSYTNKEFQMHFR